MKTVKTLLAASFVLVGSATLAPAASAECSNATLNGSYGFTFSGSSSGFTGSFVGVGLATFDGKDRVSASFDFSEGGVPTGTPPGSHPFAVPYAATYVVYPDCSGVLTGDPTLGSDNFTFVIVKGGTELFMVDISANNSITADVKKVSSE